MKSSPLNEARNWVMVKICTVIPHKWSTYLWTKNPKPRGKATGTMSIMFHFFVVVGMTWRNTVDHVGKVPHSRNSEFIYTGMLARRIIPMPPPVDRTILRDGRKGCTWRRSGRRNMWWSLNKMAHHVKFWQKCGRKMWSSEVWGYVLWRLVVHPDAEAYLLFSNSMESSGLTNHWDC